MSSDTERFYAAIVVKLGGTRSWEQLQPIEQMQFIQALNIMLQICSQ
jgi:predicted small integral membrane protein